TGPGVRRASELLRLVWRALGDARDPRPDASGGRHGTRFVECFTLAADDALLPDDPPLRAALRAYMEWAVAEVMSYSPKDSVVPADLPVPHWSWGGLENR
ncbi:MAG: hypothetical protein ACRDV4_00360, partial [Acidimicrobiales bacterium]